MSDYRGCRIIQCFLVQSNMVSVSHNMVGLERMLDYRGVGLQRFHCMYVHECTYVHVHTYVCVYTYICVCTYVHVCMCVHAYVCVCACVYICDQFESCPVQCERPRLWVTSIEIHQDVGEVDGAVAKVRVSHLEDHL